MSVETWTWQQASDAATPAGDLASIARERPDLRPALAANPSTYPALVSWLAGLGDPQVDSALISAGRMPARPTAGSVTTSTAEPMIGQRATSSPPRRRIGPEAIIAIVIGTVLVAAVSFGLGFVSGRASVTIPSPIFPVEDSSLMGACEQGDMAACDSLWSSSPAGSSEEDFAGTCGNRAEYDVASCEARFGSTY